MKFTLAGGKATVAGVKNSVDAEQKDSSPGADDADLHEEGGHTEKNTDGEMHAVKWKPGSKQIGSNKPSITTFNGVQEPTLANLGDFWHTHTGGTSEEIVDGETEYFRSAPGPSPADKNVSGQYPGITSIQVDLYGGKTVNFINDKGIIFSMNYKNFLKLAK